MTTEQRAQLENWVRAPSTPQKIVLRARICLLAHEGLSNSRIAHDLGTSRPTVLLWRQHFVNSGVAGLEHEPPRKASSRRTEDKQIKAIVEATLHTKPDDATHWSCRTLAAKIGVSHMTIARVWDNHGLQLRIPMKADSCSDSYRTPIRRKRTDVGAKRRCAGSNREVSDMKQG